MSWTKEELKTAFSLFTQKCEETGHVRTLPGLCRSLNISKEEYKKLREGEFKHECEQIELSIKHECINKGIKSLGAWKYLENEFPNEYRKDTIHLLGEAPLPILNLSVHFTAINPLEKKKEITN